MEKNILIAGGSGMIGLALMDAFRQKDYDSGILTRSPDRHPDIKAWKWDAAAGEIDSESLRWADVLINLSGAGIADKKWTAKRKEEILTSRTQTTSLLAKAINDMTADKPELVINASAIGIYGQERKIPLDENSALGNDFMSEVCAAWENSAEKFTASGIRCCIARIGIVLDTSGGMLSKTLPLFKYRVAHYFGSGEQVYSWIHIDDICGSIIHMIENPESQGIYNLTAPAPASSKTFAKDLQIALGHKGPIIPIPSFGLKLGLGEMSQVILGGNTVMPEALNRESYVFKFPELVIALKDLLKN